MQVEFLAGHVRCPCQRIPHIAMELTQCLREQRWLSNDSCMCGQSGRILKIRHLSASSSLFYSLPPTDVSFFYVSLCCSVQQFITEFRAIQQTIPALRVNTPVLISPLYFFLLFFCVLSCVFSFPCCVYVCLCVFLLPLLLALLRPLM